ncbi:MAG: L,D-transpeptidase family protein [Bacteroidota bacterium]
MLFLAFSFNACKRTKKDDVKKIIQQINESEQFNADTFLVFDSLKLNRFIQVYPSFGYLKKDIQFFYQNRNYSFAWFDDKGMLEQASNLINHLVYEDTDEIDIVVPYRQEFINLITTGMQDSFLNTKDSITIYKELMLTAQYFNYAKLVWEGADDSARIKSGWFIPRKKLAYSNLLDSLTKSTVNIFQQEPLYPQYALLKSKLRLYKTIEKNGGFDSISTTTNKYKIGDTGIVIQQIKKRLYLEKDLTFESNSYVFDSLMLSAVLSYQSRNGLKQDGIIGKTMINQLNIPIKKIIEKLIVNMERCRWLPAESFKDYFLVNIPDYKLYVYEADTISWDMNVVVGKVMTKTAIFHGDMKYIVFSPRWTIPTSIVASEVLPAIKRNISYLAKKNFEVVDFNGNIVNPYTIAWKKYSANSLPYKIVQKSGDDNALGRVKFLFPNSFNIYMHDTPAKSYFNESARSFSHGCVRLAEPKKLAQYILRNDTTWNEIRIDTSMQQDYEIKYTIPQSIPVYIVYFTAWVDNNGHLNIRKDIYDRDERLLESLIK